jgi:hypothetical protein
MNTLKLYMVLLGCKPTGRNTEQHDVFLGIGYTLEELYPDFIHFWPEAKGRVHIDAWREVNFVDGYKIQVVAREDNTPLSSEERLFFINLGGYQEFKFEEQHYFILTVQPDRAAAIKTAKDTVFFQNNHFGKAVSHVDDKYGIDVDDIYQIDDLLILSHKKKYKINLTPCTGQENDSIHLGYIKLEDKK